MKKVILVLAVLALLPVAQASADNITVGEQLIVNTWSGATRDGNGGVFGVYSVGGTFLFPTFCVETTEYVDLGDIYSVTRLDTYIIKGGTATERLLPGPVAWLYDQYRALSIADEKSLGADYQAAIWWYATGGAAGVNNSLAVAALGHSATDVYVLGFDSSNPASSDRIQDFLVQIPPPPPSVPEPGSMLLLGTGLFGLAGAVRRRMRK